MTHAPGPAHVGRLCRARVLTREGFDSPSKSILKGEREDGSFLL